MIAGYSRKSVVLLATFAALLLATPAVAVETPEWAGEPFTATPAELLRAAEGASFDDDPAVVVLLRSGSYVFDDAGRAEQRYHLIYRIRSQDAVRGWSQVSRAWRPWYQDKPVIRARVISREGNESWLDPETVGEYSNAESGPDLYGDTRAIRGPLPGVAVGAIVEELHVVRDREPFFETGYVSDFWFGDTNPTLFSRLSLDAPASLPLRYRTFELPEAEVLRTEAEGRVRIEVRHGPLRPADRFEPFAPGDAPPGALVRFSTGESWNALASSYAAKVEARIAMSDVSKHAKKATKGIAGRAALIDALLAVVHDDVRYTGVEFGEQALVPTDPGATLGRGFGDCKDMSTLLVALLRERQIAAHVALLSTGPGADVDPDLPGLGQFNHAIVVVPGDPPTWIDPTDPHSRAGTLPGDDQGRFALVASPATTALRVTPVATPGDNRVVERREVFLASEGGGRVVETTDWSGAFQAMVRSTYGGKTEDQQRQRLERYVEGVYRSDSLSSFHFTDLEDVAGPVGLSLEASAARRAWTAPARATVTVPIGSLLSDLPGPLKEALPADDEANADEAGGRRRFDLVLPNPYVHEWQYIIHPPPGYVAAELPDASERAFGPARLSVVFEELATGEVAGTLVFDTGQSRYTPDEVWAFREELTKFYEADQPQVHFDQLGERYLGTGQVREAIDEFRTLVASYPEVALYRTQVARALLQAGLGGAARREAQRATELDPQSYIAWHTLGLVLEHDEIGRKFESGWDPERARDAQRKAIEIDPEDFNAHGELAILLEHDADGGRYTDPAKLEAAIDTYRTLREMLDVDGLATNELLALLYAGRFAEIEAVADEVPEQAGRTAIRIAAAAAARGSQEAIREATRRSAADDVRAVLSAAANWLLQTRHYPEAAVLMRAGAKGDANAVERLSLADVVARMTRHEDRPPSPDTPEGLIGATMIAALASRGSPDALVALADPTLLDLGDREQIEALLGTAFVDVGWRFRRMGLSTDVVIDMILGSSRVVVDDDDKNGFRARARFAAMFGGEETVRLYGLRDGGTVRWIGLDGMDALSAVHLAHWIDDGDLERVATWLDWLVEPTAASTGDDPLSGHPVRRFWNRGDTPDAARMRLAAASLMIEKPTAARGLARIDENCPAVVPMADSEPTAGSESGIDRDLAVSCDLARAWLAMAAEQWEASLPPLARLHEAYPDSRFALLGRIDALTRTKRFDEVRPLIAARLEKFPDDRLTLSASVMVDFAAADHTNASKRMRAMIDDGLAGPGDYNNLAWLDVVEDAVTEDTLRLAQQSAAMENYAEPSSLHTLSTVYAEMGRPDEARDVLLEVLSSRGKPGLEAVDLYILGRIAEDYGVLDEARAYYERVERPDDGEPWESSTWFLAQRRLRVMRAPRDAR